MLNTNWSCFMTSMLNTVLDPKICRDLARTSLTAHSLVVMEGDSCTCLNDHLENKLFFVFMIGD